MASLLFANISKVKTDGSASGHTSQININTSTNLHESDVLSAVVTPVHHLLHIIAPGCYHLGVGGGSSCFTHHLYVVTQLHVVGDGG